jgi:hypothetical protein
VSSKTRTKGKPEQTCEWRGVSLHINGKNLDPDKVSEFLHLLPDASGKLGQLRRGGKRRCKQGYWILSGGPAAWRIETQMKHILKRISHVKHQLQTLIEENKTVKRAYLTIAIAPPRKAAEANYYFDAELINEFTSMGIDIAISIEIVERWELIYSES